MPKRSEVNLKKKRKLKRDDKKEMFRKKMCKFCADKVDTIDYKDVAKLRKFINERGKILPNRITGNCAKHQRCTTEAIKKARFIALIPFVAD